MQGPLFHFRGGSFGFHRCTTVDRLTSKTKPTSEVALTLAPAWMSADTTSGCGSASATCSAVKPSCGGAWAAAVRGGVRVVHVWCSCSARRCKGGARQVNAGRQEEWALGGETAKAVQERPGWRGVPQVSGARAC